MKKSIYEICVPITSQEQAYRLKGICLEYGLPIWDDEFAFYYHETSGNQFYCTLDPNVDGEVSAFTVLFDTEKTIEVTESEFIQLAKEFKQ